MARLDTIFIRKVGPELFDDWQGDLAGIDIADSVENYNIEIVRAMAKQFPGVAIWPGNHGTGLIIEHDGEPDQADGDRSQNEVEATLDRVVQHLAEHPEEWLVEV